MREKEEEREREKVMKEINVRGTQRETHTQKERDRVTQRDR